MGALYIILAAILFGSNPSVEQVLLSSGMSSNLVAVWIMAASCLLAGVGALVRGESFRISRRQLGMLLLGGLIGRGVTEICLVSAYTMIPAGIATMVHFFFPTIVCLTSAVLYHEPMTGQKWAAILLSVFGLLGLAGGTSGASLRGVMVAGISSLSFGFYYLLTERSALRELPPMVMIFYIHLFAVMEVLAAVLLQGEWRLPADMCQGLTLFASGLICFLGYVFLNRGIPLVGAEIAGFVNMLEPVTSLMLSVLLFHARPSISSLLGCVLILGSMLVSSVRPGAISAALRREHCEQHL